MPSICTNASTVRKGVTTACRALAPSVGSARSEGPRLAAAAILASAALALAACGSSGNGSGGPGGSAPIVVGLFNGEAGALAQTGVLDIETAKAVFNQVNAAGGVDSHKINFVVQNETGNASDAISAMRTFQQDGIHIAIGFTLTSDGEAAAPYMDRYSIVTLGFYEDYTMVAESLGQAFLRRLVHGGGQRPV